MSVRLPTVHQRTPTQSRCYILYNIHGGLTRGALALGESLPACAWRFPLHARSRNHGGLTPAALASECERLPAKLRLLRCTNACAPGAGGVSPPWLAEPHRQGSATFAMYERTCTRSGERQLPVVHGTAPARECDFCDVRTHMHRSGGRQPPVAHGNALSRASRQCRCDCRPCTSGLRRSRATTPTTTPTAGSRRRSCVGRIAACLCVAISLHARSPNHGGLTPAALVSECERLPAKLRLLRCTNAHAPGAGGVSPPWLAEPHVQGSATFAMDAHMLRQPPVARGNALCKGNCDIPAWTAVHSADRASADWRAPDAVAVLHPRQHSRRADARRSCVGRIAACLCVAISLARAFS
jgi:hypothetical protein